MRGLVALVASIATVTLALSGCSTPDATPTAEGSSESPISGGTLTWAIPADPTTLNPQISLQDVAITILRNAYEPLLTRAEDGSFGAGLAASYEISADETEYTLTLREGITFTDGEAFDAAAVVTNYDNLRDADYNPSALIAEPVHIDSVTARDDYTVVFTLTSPYAPFLTWLSYTPIISPAAYDDPELKAGGPSIAGTGPFALTSYTKGQSISFTRNDDYDWAPAGASHSGPAYLEQIDYRILPESTTRVGALTSGQVDVVTEIATPDVTAVKDASDIDYLSVTYPGMPYSLYLNAAVAPTDDLDVRTALIEAVDLDSIVTSIYQGTVDRAWAPSTSASVGIYDDSFVDSYGNDANEAVRLLESAGWTTVGDDGIRSNSAGDRLSIPVYVTNTTSAERQSLLQAIKAQAAQNAGIELDVNVVDSASRSERVSSGDYGAVDNAQSSPDSIPFEYKFLPKDQGGFFNLSNADDPGLLEKLREGWSTTDPAARLSAYADLQKIVIDQSYIVPLVEQGGSLASSSDVHGVSFRLSWFGAENAYDVWIDPQQ